jgi:hypothetical protein
VYADQATFAVGQVVLRKQIRYVVVVEEIAVLHVFLTQVIMAVLEV